LLITAFGHPKGYISNVGQYLESDKELVINIEKAIKNNLLAITISPIFNFSLEAAADPTLMIASTSKLSIRICVVLAALT